MSLEVATYVSDLQATNPPSTDPRGQGDDHLRLVKAVLQSTFPNATKAFYFPRTSSKSADYTILATDIGSTFLVSTAGAAVNLTLPTLAAGDAGWEVSVIKTNSGANPIYVVPASGTLTSGGITGMAKARRAAQGIMFRIIWDGTTWFVTRTWSLPLGSVVDNWGSSLPAGCEWPNGQTLSTTNYPEYAAAIAVGGSTPDARGRVGIGTDNMGGAAGRIGSIISAGLGSVGGTESIALTLAQLPTGITSAGSNSISVTSTATALTAVSGSSRPSGGGATSDVWLGSISTLTSQGTNTINVTSNNTSGAVHGNIQPSIVLNKFLITE